MSFFLLLAKIEKYKDKTSKHTTQQDMLRRQDEGGGEKADDKNERCLRAAPPPSFNPHNFGTVFLSFVWCCLPRPVVFLRPSFPPHVPVQLLDFGEKMEERSGVGLGDSKVDYVAFDVAKEK